MNDNKDKIRKQFMRLCEWSYFPQNLEEDDDDNSSVGDNNNPPMGDDNNPPMGDNNNPPMGDNNNPPMGDDNNPPMGDDNNPPMGDDNNPPMGDNNNPPMGDDNNPPMDDMNDTSLENDDEVIDVDDITNAQEKMNTKVNKVGKNLSGVDNKIQLLMTTINKLEQMINKNNSEIDNFKKEFIKRNPTDTEKLNLRSLDSYPFNVNPLSYWHNKSIDRNNPYIGYANNDESTTDEYEIKDSDLNNYTDSEIEKSFDIDEDMKQDLKKIFDL